MQTATSRLSLAIGFCLALTACGSAAVPASQPASAAAKPASAAASTGASAKPAGSTSVAASTAAKPAASGSAAAASGPKPEKAKLEVAIAAPAGSSYTTLWVSKEAGYFANHGLDVNLNVVSASVATEGLISGQIDLYMGGTAAMAGHLAGSDVIYVAAMVDRSELMLLGKQGITTVEGLKGKGVATTSPGAFGEIAMRKTAKEHGMQVGSDIKMLFHPTPSAAETTFLSSSDAGGLIITPPESLDAKAKGYPVIVDYYQEGLRLIGPGASIIRTFEKQNPNTLKAFLEATLDGIKRSLDDPAYFKSMDAKYGKVSDQKLLDGDFEQGSMVWNKDMTVKPESIQVALDASDDPKAKTAKVADFYDNTLIEQVNKEYASKLFPNDVKG
jgi:ABC-type nitrate/sulfonate/bicarbonate transport system substrate-binding protein